MSFSEGSVGGRHRRANLILQHTHGRFAASVFARAGFATQLQQVKSRVTFVVVLWVGVLGILALQQMPCPGLPHHYDTGAMRCPGERCWSSLRVLAVKRNPARQLPVDVAALPQAC